MVEKEIKNISLKITLVTASLYMFGLTFFQGYLNHWGLEESLFPLSIETTLFQGFLGLGYLMSKAMGPLVVAVSVNFALGALLLVITKKLSPDSWVNRIVRSESKTNAGEHYPKWLKIFALWVLVVYWMFVIFFFIAVLLWSAGKMGSLVAENQQREYEEHGERNATILLKSGESFVGLSLICSAEHCAFLSEGEVSLVPMSEIASLIISPRKA